ncbi:alpha-L-fucosidase [Mucilaginibacter jinjuensis]|uniref:alpha-L-fucosidase n=1 Tax=Mucilaginibacter jinjuensis TaxID=1176721 RepID=A0ABY7TDZ9_9SPHI|nr:alpha-L-fucosidase [Mucilaginibacter jinjuensis]WCT14256.1 alpha-L-fucosidase [Mucilaginibacter jinjuensis]
MKTNMIKQTTSILLFLGIFIPSLLKAQKDNSPVRPLSELQQDFVDLRFGMFIHFNIPTYANQDWPDPEMPASAFNPTKLNCDQWAKAAKSANMSYGCITTKHHSGFCIWDTKTTDYNVMHSPLKRDVVKEYTDAFRKNGLKVFLYYSILDTHHKLRPNCITPDHIKMVKAQLTELLTKYGPIQALIIDGWDAPWSRISYDDVPFEEIYHLVKSLQPNCLLMDLNGAKYPQQALYYSDIKTYEMGAGQRISDKGNRLPSLACLPLQQNWFWETSHPTTPVKDPVKLVNETLIPLNKQNCNFILNVAPNRDGLMDDNALAALKKIGELWHNDGTKAQLPQMEAPIISHNLAKKQPANSSWSDDSAIMDFANDDDFGSSWVSNPTITKNAWYEVDFKKEEDFNAIVIAEEKSNIKSYRLEVYQNGAWKPVFNGEDGHTIKIHRFDRVKATKARITILDADHQPSIAEFEIYNEQR